MRPAVGLLLLAGATLTRPAPVRAQPTPTEAVAGTPTSGMRAFVGRYLAVLSDADMLASAYIDGALGPRLPGLRDELAIVPLTHGVPGTPRRIPVSNAVTAWPSLLVLSRDGRVAYVAETDQPRRPGATQLGDLRPSASVRVVALDDTLGGRVVQTVETAGRAQGLTLHPDGTLLAVNLVDTAQPQIGFLTVGRDGRLGGVTLATVPDVTAPPRDLAWSPDGAVLAATFPHDHTVRFYRVTRRATGAPHLASLGPPVMPGKTPGVGQWSPDGRYFFVTNLAWLAGAADQFVGADVSTLAAVRVDRRPAARHAIVSTIATGASAENFAVAPDGRTLVTLNMERSFLPVGDARRTDYASLTLVSWDAARERLVARETVRFDAILPEGITFDASGRFLAVASFAHTDPGRDPTETSVGFWRLVDDPVLALVPMARQIVVMRGAHVVKLHP